MATSAAIDCRANSASSAVDSYCNSAARVRRARGPRGRAPRSRRGRRPRAPTSRRSSCRRRARRGSPAARAATSRRQVGGRGVDARRGDAQVGVVGERLLTSASSGGSWNDASQLSATAPARRPRPPIAPAASGWAAPASRRRRAAAWSAARTRTAPATQRDDQCSCGRAFSVQLQDQVVRVRADAQDDLAQDVKRTRRVGVDRRVRRPRRPRGRAPGRSSARSNFTAKRCAGGW